MSQKLGYYIGITLGVLLIYGLYLLGLYGIFSSILNREIPYAPITMMLAVFVVRRLTQIQFYLMIRAQMESAAQKASVMDRDVQRMMSKIFGNGSVN